MEDALVFHRGQWFLLCQGKGCRCGGAWCDVAGGVVRGGLLHLKWRGLYGHSDLVAISFDCGGSCYESCQSWRVLMMMMMIMCEARTPHIGDGATQQQQNGTNLTYRGRCYKYTHEPPHIGDGAIERKHTLRTPHIGDGGV